MTSNHKEEAIVILRELLLKTKMNSHLQKLARKCHPHNKAKKIII
jgi:hypothetical protein